MMLSLKMALRSIGSNKMRAVLTMLGIIIGVVALVVLVSLVDGATSSVTDENLRFYDSHSMSSGCISDWMRQHNSY